MQINIFTHPEFIRHQSMPRFTNMVADGLRSYGHEVNIYAPKEYFFKLPLPGSLKKWMGYIDQFLIFPKVIKKLTSKEKYSFYIFIDHALGIWVPKVKHLPHLIICHDFLAQQSAAGKIPQNVTGWSGKVYQQLIRNGYTQGKNFISVSSKSQQDLHAFLGQNPNLSRVVYNGLNKKFEVIAPEKARGTMQIKTGLSLAEGYILHVGGNQWYKNRPGVVKIYEAWRSVSHKSIPLLLIGEEPDQKLQDEINQSVYKADIHALSQISDDYINSAYSGALVLLFPSLAEGFGWPIAEAMACGCPVITTNEAPMTEVGGEAAIYIPARPVNEGLEDEWASDAAKALEQICNLPADERISLINKGIVNSNRFDTKQSLKEIENIISEIAAC